MSSAGPSGSEQDFPQIAGATSQALAPQKTGRTKFMEGTIVDGPL